MKAKRVVLAIDTSDINTADELIKLAKNNGGEIVKFGLEFATAYSWKQCAELARANSVKWIADAKLDDIPHTVERAVINICNFNPRPLGITVHIKAGDQTLRLAQAVAKDTIIFGVTELTAVPQSETLEKYEVSRDVFVNRLIYFAQRAQIKGVVVSGKEIEFAKKSNFVTLVPGIRSLDTSKDDQSNTVTPHAALQHGADYIVVGRQITQATNPKEAYQKLLAEI